MCHNFAGLMAAFSTYAAGNVPEITVNGMSRLEGPLRITSLVRRAKLEVPVRATRARSEVPVRVTSW